MVYHADPLVPAAPAAPAICAVARRGLGERRVCGHAFEEFGLVKITAHVFPHNPASARVLEKCGFQQEGFLRQHFLKDGRFIDVRLFGLLR